jgi:hypothetical protein
MKLTRTFGTPLRYPATVGGMRSRPLDAFDTPAG